MHHILILRTLRTWIHMLRSKTHPQMFNSTLSALSWSRGNGYPQLSQLWKCRCYKLIEKQPRDRHRYVQSVDVIHISVFLLIGSYILH